MSQRFFQLVPAKTNIDFVGKYKYVATCSVLFIIATIIGFAKKGLNYGIDFTGGTQIQVRFAEPQTPEQVRALVDQVVADSEVVASGGDHREYLITARSAGDVHGEKALQSNLIEKAGGAQKLQILQADVVGPRTGSELRSAAALSLFYSVLLILIYIWFRFDVKFAPGAIVALFHDLLVAVGFYVFTGWEFTITSVAALLTIAGYSVNDTIIVYDRIREMFKTHGTTRVDKNIINLALNDTLSRTITTSFIVFISLIPIIVFTEGDIEGFAYAMLVGVVVGCLSTIFIAVPFTLFMQRFTGAEDKKRPGKPVPGSKPQPTT